MSERAKLFMDGPSQAVRLPEAFRFDADEVSIRKDPESGDVILSARPTDWAGYFEIRNGADIPEGFLSPEERTQGSARRDPLEGLDE